MEWSRKKPNTSRAHKRRKEEAEEYNIKTVDPGVQGFTDSSPSLIAINFLVGGRTLSEP